MSAAFVLGQLYIKGLGMAKDSDVGLRLISQSANAGNYQAMTTLASLLANGQEVPQDSQQAAADNNPMPDDLRSEDYDTAAYDDGDAGGSDDWA